MSNTDPVEVVIKGSGEVVGYACGVCGVVWTTSARRVPESLVEQTARTYAQARRCCSTVCLDCGAVLAFRSWCEPCYRRRSAEKDAAAVAKATKIPAAEYKGWVCWGDHGPREGYFESVEALIEYCAAHEIASPPFVWACSPVGLALDADDILDSALEEHHEDARSCLEDIEGLREFIDTWTAKQTLVSYFEDRSRAVVLGGTP